MTDNAVCVTITLEYNDLSEDQIEEQAYADLQDLMRTTPLEYWAKIRVDNFE